MNILIIGAPGSGKGTMSEMIVNKYEIAHISTGDILRSAIKEGSDLGKLAMKYINKGLLVPDEVVNEIIEKRLENDDVLKGFLMDGYPRTLSQALSFEKILKKLGKKIDYVLQLDIDDILLSERITGRRICPNCKSVYHIKNAKPKVSGVCDKCDSNLVQRKDDTLESLKVRLETYHEQTAPMIKHYQELGLIKVIDANNSKMETFGLIKKVLGEEND